MINIFNNYLKFHKRQQFKSINYEIKKNIHLILQNIDTWIYII